MVMQINRFTTTTTTTDAYYYHYHYHYTTTTTSDASSSASACHTTTTATDSPSSISSCTVSEPQRTDSNAPHPTNIIHQQIPPATHQTASHQHHNALHQTLPHAVKQEPVREVTRPSSSLTNTAIPGEIISFLRFLKSFI